MGLITELDIKELESKLEDLKTVKVSLETEKKESELSSVATFEEITQKTTDLNKVKSDIELNAKLQEDFGKLVDEKQNLLNVTVDAEKANSASREALQIKLDTSYKEQDSKTLEKKAREAKKADLEQSLTNLNADIAKMQTEYDAMADGPDKDNFLLKIQDAQAKAKDVSDSINAEATAIAALQTELDALSTSIEADNAAMKALEAEHKAIAELISKTETELADAKMARKAAIDDGTEMATEAKAIEDNLTELNQDYNKAKAHIKQLTSEISDIEQEIKSVEESDLLQQFEAERKTRKVHVRQTLKNKERIKALINNSNIDIKDKQTEFNNDTEIFIKDIKSELNVDGTADNIINDAISNLNDKYNNEGKGALGVFPADEAFKLTRESLFDLELAGINKKIKAACQKGLTSIDLSEDEITGPQILALNSGNYKISHYEVKQQSNVAALYRDATKLVIRIDWGFASES